MIFLPPHQTTEERWQREEHRHQAQQDGAAEAQQGRLPRVRLRRRKAQEGRLTLRWEYKMLILYHDTCSKIYAEIIIGQLILS